MIDRSKYYLQAPVGNRSYVRGRRRSQARAGGLNDIDGWDTTWLGSGTMSLAVAALIAVERKPVAAPKVLVPAYGCPDIVSAVRYAGAEPIYVDLLPNQSRMNLDLARQAAISRRDVVAVIGVDLFGIPEDWEGLRRLAIEFDFFLIQDSAQSMQDEQLMLKEFSGDAVVFSFGRGKPVCCFSGGALLTRNSDSDSARPVIAQLKKQTGQVSPQLINTKSLIYDFLLWPFAYAQFAKIMGNRLGATHYKPLKNIVFLSDRCIDLVNAAINRYWGEHHDAVEKLVIAISDVLEVARNDEVRMISDARVRGENRRLSRLPLLVTKADSRSQLLNEFRKNGISATTMYGRSLPEIVAKFDNKREAQKYPNAESFAESLITLPTHARLTRHDIDAIAGVLNSVGVLE